MRLHIHNIALYLCACTSQIAAVCYCPDLLLPTDAPERRHILSSASWIASIVRWIAFKMQTTVCILYPRSTLARATHARLTEKIEARAKTGKTECVLAHIYTRLACCKYTQICMHMYSTHHPESITYKWRTVLECAMLCAPSNFSVHNFKPNPPNCSLCW